MDRPRQFDPLRNVEQMVSLLSEVTGKPSEQIVEALREEIRHPGRTVAAAFRRHGGPRYEFGPHLQDFYELTDSFLIELAVWNRNHLKTHMRKWTSRQLDKEGGSREVLSFGDGLGFDSLHLARRGHRVTYFEQPGLGERFARRLFELTGNSVKVVTDPRELTSGTFDVITCFDVLEHVPDPPATVRQLASYLKPGGLLYVSAPFYMLLGRYPTHLRSNRRFSGDLRLYRDAGLTPLAGRWGWNPIVFRKAECDTGRLPLGPRLGGLLQRIGRVTAVPFLGMHLVRWAANRPLRTPS